MARRFFSGGTMPSYDLLPRLATTFALEQRWAVDGTHYARTAEAWLDRLHANEHELEQRFGLKEVHVVEAVSDDETEITRDLAVAAAAILGQLSQEAPTVAWSSWSRTLRATVDALLPLHIGTTSVVEMVGDLGATRLLLGFGLLEFSMQPAQLLPIKQQVLRSSIPDVEAIARKILRTDDPEKRQALLDKLNA